MYDIPAGIVTSSAIANSNRNRGYNDKCFLNCICSTDADQTMTMTNIELLIKNTLAQKMQEFLSRISSLITEAFSVKLDEEQPRERELLLISMIRNHLGSKVREPLLKELISKQAKSKDRGSINRVETINYSTLKTEAAIESDVSNSRNIEKKINTSS